MPPYPVFSSCPKVAQMNPEPTFTQGGRRKESIPSKYAHLSHARIATLINCIKIQLGNIVKTII
jgi:hypothetical protein